MSKEVVSKYGEGYIMRHVKGIRDGSGENAEFFLNRCVNSAPAPNAINKKYKSTSTGSVSQFHLVNDIKNANNRNAESSIKHRSFKFSQRGRCSRKPDYCNSS